MASQGAKRQDVWRNRERHYCSYCNVWMGSDKQSILIHENGKKHCDNVEKSLKQRRQDKKDEEKKKKALDGMLQKISQAAGEKVFEDLALGAFAPGTAHQTRPSNDSPEIDAVEIEDKKKQKIEKKSWEARKRKREEERQRTRRQIDENSDEHEKQATRRKIDPNEGHYTIGDTTYLEGCIFAALLEEDIPVQIWTGHREANLAEKRLLEKQHLWKNGLVAKTRQSGKGEVVVDVARLLKPTDTEETLEKSVNADNLRIVLGMDENLPATVEEARLTAMGGEVTQVNESLEIDENTGLSTWGTVSVTRTTVQQEQQEERARARAKRRQEAERQEQLQKEADARKMEEARVENADDSALGAYDVWSRGKAGYKGVDIHKEVKLSVQDSAKSLSKGVNVEFKQRSSAFKKAKKKQNRRTTSADDD